MKRGLRSGDRVELRSPAEIVATLDENGCLDGVPFMPEMLSFFGRSFTVAARVERACDTIGRTGARRIPATVILGDLRCDGSAHAGCQAQCRIYWKEAWLRRSTGAAPDPGAGEGRDEFERLASAFVRAPGSTAGAPLYRCQATEMVRASEPIAWWSVRSFVHELTSGNVGVWRFARVMTRIVLEEVGRRLRILSSNPFRPEQLPEKPVAQPAPRGLAPGQLVQIKPKEEIGRTLNKSGKNRGLWFDREMVPYCGHTARVKTRVNRFVDERTGQLVELKSDCYILDGVVCESYRSEGRWFCPRAIYPWWRESWLEPVDAVPSASETEAVVAEAESATAEAKTP